MEREVVEVGGAAPSRVRARVRIMKKARKIPLFWAVEERILWTGVGREEVRELVVVVREGFEGVVWGEGGVSRGVMGALDGIIRRLVENVWKAVVDFVVGFVLWDDAGDRGCAKDENVAGDDDVEDGIRKRKTTTTANHRSCRFLLLLILPLRLLVLLIV